MSIDGNKVRELSLALLDAAMAIADKHGLQATTRGGRFEDGWCAVKIEFFQPRKTPYATATRMTDARTRWLKEHRAFELGRNLVGQKFPWEGTQLTVVGLELDGDARVVLARQEGGKMFVQLPPSVVAHIFATRDAATGRGAKP